MSDYADEREEIERISYLEGKHLEEKRIWEEDIINRIKSLEEQLGELQRIIGALGRHPELGKWLEGYIPRG